MSGVLCLDVCCVVFGCVVLCTAVLMFVYTTQFGTFLISLCDQFNCPLRSMLALLTLIVTLSQIQEPACCYSTCCRHIAALDGA